MKRLGFALGLGGLVLAAPLAAQQHPMMGQHVDQTVCGVVFAMHAGMAGMGGAGPMEHRDMRQSRPGMQADQDEMTEHSRAMLSMLPPAALLASRETLKLTDDQVERLQKLQNEGTEDRQKAMGEIREEMQKAHEALQKEKPDLGAYGDAMKEASEHQIDQLVASLKAAMEARETLTDQQRAQLPDVARDIGRQCMAMMRQGAPR